MVAPLVMAGAGMAMKGLGSLFGGGKDEGQERFNQLRQLLQQYGNLPGLGAANQNLMGQGQALQSQALGLLGQGYSGDKEAALYRENAMRKLGMQTRQEQGSAAAGMNRTGMGASGHARAVQGDILNSSREAGRGIESDAALLGPQLAAAKQQMTMNMLQAGQGTAADLRNFQMNLMNTRMGGLGMLAGVPITGKSGGAGGAMSQIGGTLMGSGLGNWNPSAGGGLGRTPAVDPNFIGPLPK